MGFAINHERLKAVLSYFVEGSEILETEILPGGHIHQTLRVELATDQARRSVIVQKLNTDVFSEPEKIMANIKFVSDHLNRKKRTSQDRSYSMEVLSPMETIDGRPGMWYEGSYWRVFPFFHDALCASTAESSEVAYSAGLAFGQFGYFLGDLDTTCLHETITGFHSGRLRIRQFEDAKREDRVHRHHSIKDFIDELHSCLGTLETFDDLKNNLPKRVIHHDAKLNNVLLNQHSYAPVAVIDLDTVMPGSVLSDFGDLVRSLTSPHAEDVATTDIQMNMPFFEALSRGYLEACGSILTPQEGENLVFGACAITLMVATRFTTDYLNGDCYFETSYPDQNLDRARNQFALFKEFESRSTTMNTYIERCLTQTVKTFPASS